MEAKNYILPYFPMICDKNFTNDEKLEFILKAMTEYAQALQLLQPDVIKSVCSCGRREINVLSGICDICWNEKFPDEQTVL